MFYSTNWITKNTKQDILDIANTYPISITNEQGILNLYFQNKNIYQELPEYFEEYLLYYYWKIKEKKIIITKQLTEQYK